MKLKPIDSLLQVAMFLELGILFVAFLEPNELALAIGRRWRYLGWDSIGDELDGVSFIYFIIR